MNLWSEEVECTVTELSHGASEEGFHPMYMLYNPSSSPEILKEGGLAFWGLNNSKASFSGHVPSSSQTKELGGEQLYESR